MRQCKVLQAKVSAMTALNQVPMSSKWSPFQPTEAPPAAATGAMVRVVALYWNTAFSHEALFMVMVE